MGCGVSTKFNFSINLVNIFPCGEEGFCTIKQIYKEIYTMQEKSTIIQYIVTSQNEDFKKLYENKNTLKESLYYLIFDDGTTCFAEYEDAAAFIPKDEYSYYRRGNSPMILTTVFIIDTSKFNRYMLGKYDFIKQIKKVKDIRDIKIQIMNNNILNKSNSNSVVEILEEDGENSFNSSSDDDSKIDKTKKSNNIHNSNINNSNNLIDDNVKVISKKESLIKKKTTIIDFKKDCRLLSDYDSDSINTIEDVFTSDPIDIYCKEIIKESNITNAETILNNNEINININDTSFNEKAIESLTIFNNEFDNEKNYKNIENFEILIKSLLTQNNKINNSHNLVNFEVSNKNKTSKKIKLEEFKETTTVLKNKDSKSSNNKIESSNSLKQLQFMDQEFSDKESKPRPKFLKSFLFYDNSISENTSKTIWKIIYKFICRKKTLKKEKLNSIQIDERKFKVLRVLNLSMNRITDNIFNKLIRSFKHVRLHSLNLSGNLLTNNSMKNLSIWLNKNKSLTVLNLSNNLNIDTEGFKQLFLGLKNHAKLNTLNLSRINLNGGGVLLKRLLSSFNNNFASNIKIKSNKNLSSKNKRLINNSKAVSNKIILNIDKINDIEHSVCRLTNLIVKDCSFSMLDITELFESISSKSCTLECLDISENNKNNNEENLEVSKLLIGYIGNSTSLFELNIDKNNVTQYDLLADVLGSRSFNNSKLSSISISDANTNYFSLLSYLIGEMSNIKKNLDREINLYVLKDSGNLSNEEDTLYTEFKQHECKINLNVKL